MTLLAAAALYTARPVLAALLLVISLIHHLAAHLLGERLLKPSRLRARSRAGLSEYGLGL